MAVDSSQPAAKRSGKKRKADLEQPTLKKQKVDNLVQQDEQDKKERKRLRKEAKRLAKLQAGDQHRLERTQRYLVENGVSIHQPPSQESIHPVLDFIDLDIHADLRQSLSGFDNPTPIQACAWPPLMSKQDVIGVAETGSGKTLAFGIPAVSHILEGLQDDTEKANMVKILTLVVAPTRELAIQTHETFAKLGKPFNIRSVCVYGGVGKSDQVKQLRDPRTKILVGTPGRLLDLTNENVCDLSSVKYLVLDEADRMLDKGFENDMRRIIALTSPSKERQTAMFSATWPESVKQLASSFLRDPVRIVVGSDELSANKKVTQSVHVFDDSYSKDSRLFTLLKTLQAKRRADVGDLDYQRILVFVLYKKEATRVENSLRRQGYTVAGLHGDLSQDQRIAALNNFKSGRVQLLVATDVAARGLDIANVGAVINYSFPLTVEDYIHRIGRTGRGGKEGTSITFFTGENHERALAGEFARVLRESGFDAEPLKKFPMTVKKKEHGAYGAFYRDDIQVPSSQKIKF